MCIFHCVQHPSQNKHMSLNGTHQRDRLEQEASESTRNQFVKWDFQREGLTVN